MPPLRLHSPPRLPKPTSSFSSKIDTGGRRFGNIILSVLNANDIKTTNRVQLGATPVVRKAIIAGEIDIYPEYTATPPSSSRRPNPA